MILFSMFTACNDSDGNREPQEDDAMMVGVHAAFFNSKGTRCALATTAGNVIVTDALLNEIGRFHAHEGGVTSSFFSPDDNFIVTGGPDSVLRVWDSQDYSLVQEHHTGFGIYTCVMGYQSAVGCGQGGRLIRIPTQSDLSATHWKFDADGAYFLYFLEIDSTILCAIGSMAIEFDVTTGMVGGIYDSHVTPVFCAMPSPDMTKIITASADSTVIVWDRVTGRPQQPPLTFDSPVFVACFSPCGAEIAVATAVGDVIIIDENGKRRAKRVFPERVNTIHFSPNGKFIVAGSELFGVKLLSVDSMLTIASFDN